MHSTRPIPFSNLPQTSIRVFVCAVVFMLLAACGFHLKGVSPLPFTTLYTNIPENSEFGAGLRRAIIASSPATRFVSEPAQAQARLEQLGNRQTLREISLDTDGQVEEYELNIEFVFQLTNAQGNQVLPPTTLRVTREVPYDSQQVQAKQSEIGVVFMQMRQSLIDRIVRHLSSPDVSEAFSNPEILPFNDIQVPDVPAHEPETPTPWSDPSKRSGSGFF
ncbi:LPS assembly lipoprotein LptE [Pusillimonas sp. ANT_WB101]|uniref:LPS-assembly lipoprotein LptE n=1 Tax=Pusillimonas sp. ANT_WB101 TaxID=2597356 RepID=UPI0011EF3567|nr:LPS assembly lipoprotein LptE [Pusillimonas sp. ANT_WB101]KAA0910593.1 hypothetical protein FQ179_01560 [Pusillimonas sp. ANT_WB101]